MAVVIQQPDPFAAVSSAAEGFAGGRDKAMALALAKQKQAVDERNATRALDLQQSQVESENHARDISSSIAQEQHVYEMKIRPMLEQLTQAQISGQLTQNDVLSATLAGQKIDNEVKARLAKLGIPEKQAEAALVETRQRIQTDIAQQHAAEAQQRSTEQLLPGQIQQQKALTSVYQHEAAAPYPTPGGSAGIKAADAARDAEADYQLGVGAVDDALKEHAPEEVIQSVRGWQVGPQVKLRLIRYIQSKPKPAAAPQGGGGGFFPNIMRGLSGAPPAQIGPGT